MYSVETHPTLYNRVVLYRNIPHAVQRIGNPLKHTPRCTTEWYSVETHPTLYNGVILYRTIPHAVQRSNTLSNHPPRCTTEWHSIEPSPTLHNGVALYRTIPHAVQRSGTPLTDHKTTPVRRGVTPNEDIITARSYS